MIWGFRFYFYLHSFVGLCLYLNMEGPGQLVTALCPHAFILCVVERMEGQVLNFLVILEQTCEIQLNAVNCTIYIHTFNQFQMNLYI